MVRDGNEKWAREEAIQEAEKWTKEEVEHQLKDANFRLPKIAQKRIYSPYKKLENSLQKKTERVAVEEA